MEAPYDSSSGGNRYVNLHHVNLYSIDKNEEEEEYLVEDDEVYQDTLRLVECAMFAAVFGQAFLWSNSRAMEVATVVLFFVLPGPVKAATYLHIFCLILEGRLGYLGSLVLDGFEPWKL